FEKLPTGYSGWRYKVASSQMPVPTEGEVLIGSYDYSEGRDILVNAGDYLLLVAVNASNRVQGYRQFPIEEGQIRQAGNVAEELELGQDYNNPISGTVAGTIRFAGLNLPEGTTKWQYRLRDLPTTAPMEDATVLDAVDYGIVATDDGGNIGKNISVVAGRYLTLLATDADGRVKKYATVQVMEKDIAVKAKSLEHNTHYPYPTPIDEGEDYHGKFAWLNFGSGSAKLEGATTWYYHVAETNSFEIPAVGAKIGEIPFFKGDDEKNKAGFKIYDPDNPEAINAKVNGVYGDLMLVAANAEDTILAYVILPLSGENVKLPEHEEARELQPLQEGETNNALKHYKLPLEMGSVPGTTKLQLLGNAGFGSANRWQIQVSDGPIPIPQEGTRLGNVTIANYYHASTYPFAGRDIPVKAGDYMMLYLTDADGFVEGYAKIGEKNEAAEIVIPEEWVRPPLAKEFIIGQHYSRPSVGAAAGTTRIELLNAPEGVDVYYTVETAPLDRPSGGDALPENAEVNLSKKQNESGKNYVDIDGVQANNYLALYGVQKDDDGNKHIHYFSNVLLSALQIREIDAKKLEIIEDANGGHYTAVEIGTEVGHVRIMKLDFGGISSDNLPINHLRWQVKVQPEALTFEPEGADTIALNTHIRPPNDSYLDNYYTEGKNIPIEEGQHLILYATDHHGGIKGYRDLGKMQADSIAEEAEALVAIDGEDGHYSTPVKGVDTGTTRIETLKGESNWGANYKWYYRVENPPVDYVGIKDLKLNVEEDFKAYNAGQDIPILAGQEIVLVATDEDGLIQAYGVIPVSGEQIQLPSAKVEGTAFADDLNEGHIREGGREIVIELENGKWVEDIATSEAKRNALFEGFHPFTEEHQWQKVVARLKADGVGAIRVDENFKIVTILLPATGDYGLHEYQTVRLTIPPEVIENASTKTVANQELRIAPMVSATVSGTVITPGIGEAEIRSGGGTIRLTLDKGMWLHDIASDGNTTEEMQEIRKFLLEGLSTTTDTKALNLLVEEMIEIVIGSEEEPATKGKPSAVLTRNTARELTITLPKVKDYNLNLGDQEVTVTIPAEAIIDGTTDVVASPSFTIKKAIPYIFDIKAEALENGNTVKMKGSESTSPLEENNTWTIKIEEGTLKEEISLEDITFEGLPAGLGVREVTRLDSDRHIQLPLSGTATTSIKDKTEVKLTIKHTMVQESGARDSQPISLWIAPGEFPIEAKAREGRDTITMLAPDNLKVLDGEDTWVIEVTEGAVKEDVSIEDLSFENALPTGLEATAKKGDGNTIEILVGGTANNKVEKKITEIKIRINKTAVLEGGAGDMEGTLTLKIATVESIDFPNLESPVGIHVKNNKLTNTTSAMEYSLDSTDGRDGTWHPASGSG
ncbi:MAG: hypothetical protein JJT76_20085, partial [Clostridiaceae bacterium]|nr:hypothetical protein [Clostridiaceae bacterium]